MSYTYLQAQGEESSADSYSDMNLSALSNSNQPQEKCSCNGSGMECCHASLFGMMSQPSTAIRGVEKWMWSAADSPAKTYPALEVAKDLKANGLDSGVRCAESLAKYDPATSSWKTAQCSLFADLAESLETWPRWGIMLHGECWARQTPAEYTHETESGYLPTLRKQIQDRPCREREDYHSNLEEYLGNHFPFLRGSLCDPDFAEWMMGWPIGWTDSVPLETDKFRLWLHSHGKSSTLN